MILNHFWFEISFAFFSSFFINLVVHWIWRLRTFNGWIYLQGAQVITWSIVYLYRMLENSCNTFLFTGTKWGILKNCRTHILLPLSWNLKFYFLCVTNFSYWNKDVKGCSTEKLKFCLFCYFDILDPKNFVIFTAKWDVVF